MRNIHSEFVLVVPKTTVTPNIYDLFSHMAFGKVLGRVEPATTPVMQTEPCRHAVLDENCFKGFENKPTENIQRGDVISIPPDSDIGWAKESTKDPWRGLVQTVRSHKGISEFHVLWLYRPADTGCGQGKYPWKKELFLSDNCTCHTGGTSIRSTEVVGAHKVDWFGDQNTKADFFVRQTYLTSEHRWKSLEHRHMDCGDTEKDDSPEGCYRQDDTVFIQMRDSILLQPHIIEGIFYKGEKRHARVRQLPRRCEMDDTRVPDNELVYSTLPADFTEVLVEKIYDRCYVRCFRPGENITAPYNRQGTGNFFIIAYERTELGLVPISPISAAYIRTNRYVPFLDWVDNLLHLALVGREGIPKPGDVDFISAGSLCPGFSLLTADKTTLKQQKNQYFIASFASFIDHYRPAYGLLEDVTEVVGNNPGSCVFSQLLCAIVGLGYQARVVWLYAWAHGAPQSRSRLFLCFAAPGYHLPRAPEPTHSYPIGTVMKQIGKLANGQPFGKREEMPTAFGFFSAEKATVDLPHIYDGKPDLVLGFPDHRIACPYTNLLRKQLAVIPIQPFAMGFSRAWYGTDRDRTDAVIKKADRDNLFPAERDEKGKVRERLSKLSRGWTRIHPKSLFSTVTTACTPTDSRTGRWNHWDQLRPASLLEARRAQGFLDSEVIIGEPRDQWHTVGNSVVHQVLLALGLAIREAWFGTLLDDDDETPTTTTGGVADEKRTGDDEIILKMEQTPARVVRKRRLRLAEAGISSDTESTLFDVESPYGTSTSAATTPAPGSIHFSYT